MKRLLMMSALGAAVAVSAAEVEVSVERLDSARASSAFEFKAVPKPMSGDRAEKGKFTVLSGNPDSNGGGIERLNDGALPRQEDAPRSNFFFAGGSEGGRILLDLGEAVEIRTIHSYSWHPSVRAPQRYSVAGAVEAVENWETKKLEHIVTVDTSGQGVAPGGQHAAKLFVEDGAVGKFRYLVFDIQPSVKGDPFGQTFFSEIDVIAAGDETKAIEAEQRHQKTVLAGNGKYELIIDTTDAADLREWTEKELAPVIAEWYPKLVEMLPSEGYEAPTRVNILFDPQMRGVAAASGSRIRGSAEWYRNNLKGEAVGSIVHELVHVVQNYGVGRRNNPNATRTPGWIVEGIPDYIRWFIYEPQTKGAEITARNFERAKFDSNYRISANFLNWVVAQHGRDLIVKLNAAAREGRYKPEFWTEATGKTVEELGEAWRAENAKRLGIDAEKKD